MKKLIALLLAMIMVLSMAACSSKPAEPAPEKEDASTEEKAPAEEKEEKPAPEEPAEKTTLVVYDNYAESYNGAEAVLYRAMLETFAAENPDIDLQVTHFPGDMYMTKMQTLAASDELPHVFPMLLSTDKEFYAAGLIQDLAPIFDADPAWRDSFLPGAFKDQTGDNGEILGMPYTTYVNGVIFYNSDILAECGYDSFPSTMDELAQMITDVKAAGYIPCAAGDKMHMVGYDLVCEALAYRYMEPEMIEGMATGEMKLTDDAFLNNIKKAEELAKLGMFNEDLASLDLATAQAQYFMTGKAAMYLGGSYEIATILGQAPEEVSSVTKMAFMPMTDDVATNYICGGAGWGWCLGAHADGAAKDAALRFMKAMTSTELQQAILDNGAEPSISGLTANEETMTPIFASYMEAKKNAVMSLPPFAAFSATMYEEARNGYGKLLIGQITADELAAHLQEVYEAEH